MKSSKIKCICEECGKVFYRYPSELKIRPGINSAGRFCSRRCMENSRRHGSYVKCTQCGKIFYRRFGEQDLGSTIHQFCSKECYEAFRSLHLKGNVYPKIGADHVHRLVAEKYLHRKLKKGEVVHHIDKNRHNNSPSNLIVFPNQRNHMLYHQGGYSLNELQGIFINKAN